MSVLKNQLAECEDGSRLYQTEGGWFSWASVVLAEGRFRDLSVGRLSLIRGPEAGHTSIGWSVGTGFINGHGKRHGSPVSTLNIGRFSFQWAPPADTPWERIT